MIDSTAPILAFSSQQQFHDWLEANHDSVPGIWLRIYKKNSRVATVSNAEALQEVLCFGWIDGIRRAYDNESFIQSYTPRRAKSIWSKVNVEHVEKLIAEGLMQPAGLAVVEAAKKDGRWQKAYDSQKNMQVPDDFLLLLETNKAAKNFFESLNKQNKYAIAFRLHNAKKPETRLHRLELFFEMMKKGEKFH